MSLWDNTSISKHAGWFPDISQLGQPMETAENPETREPGHPCPIPGNLTNNVKYLCGGDCGNLQKHKKPTEKDN